MYYVFCVRIKVFPKGGNNDIQLLQAEVGSNEVHLLTF